jgi:hypothetical protein
MVGLAAQPLETWEVALYGFMTVIAMGVLQFFITSYFRKAEKMKDDKIDEIFDLIKELNLNVKILTEKISDHAIQIALCKEKFTGLEKKVDEHEKRLNSKS